jgi:glutamate--cysteine ligase
LQDHGAADLLRDSLIGIEKESLRVNKAGSIALTPHPMGLGEALTHPQVTTDYSEAQLELITRPHSTIPSVLAELDELHRWVYSNLDEESLWVTSMPCVLHGEQSIPIADYGSSNAGMMKTVYRRGLGYRYGKIMQAISGVHFNFSLSPRFWQVYQTIEGDASDPKAFRTTSYMAMVRNLQRCGWLVPYLYGASPAVCESFLNGEPTTLEYFGHHTYYEPFATSLRLGDIGYQNSKEGSTGVKVCYDSLDSFVASLEKAMETPCPVYASIGVKVDGEYRQLNANQLQIENEYYSSVRAKAVLDGLQKPVRGLQQKGIEYIELRSVDVNAFEPLGVSEDQMCFLEAMVVCSLLRPSPPIDANEVSMINENLGLVAHCGRDPQLRLSTPKGRIKLRDWACKFLDDMEQICLWLDESHTTNAYSHSWQRQQDKISDPGLIPSTRMIDMMVSNKESFFDFAMRKSQKVADHFTQRPLGNEALEYRNQQVRDSREKALLIEAGNGLSFEKFLADYFSQ